MTDISRRTFAKTIGAALLGLFAPPVPAGQIGGKAIAAPLTTFAVGTPGEYDWSMIKATSESDAQLRWIIDRCGMDRCEPEPDDDGECMCEFCFESRADLRVEHVPQLDDKSEREITPGDWLRAGLGHMCSRCDYETDSYEGGHGIGDEAVCPECMTLADWRIADEERWRELVEEQDGREWRFAIAATEAQPS